MQDDATAERAPGIADGIATYLAIRGWLDRDALPAADAPEASVSSTGVEGVCVILRLDGRVVGVGQDARGDAQMARRAAGEAVSKALGDDVIRSVRAAANDAITARLSLEVELAGPLRPLLGRTIAEAAARLVPGRDGIAVRRGDQTVRAFPSRLALTDLNDRPAGVITSLLADAGLPAKDLNEFATDERVSLARFASLRVRGDTPDASPTAVERGGRTIGLREIGQHSAAAIAAVLAARLSAEVTDVPTSEGGTSVARLRGTYDPTRNRWEPLLAPPDVEALALLALGRAAGSDALAEPLRDASRAAATRLFHSVASRPDAERAAATDAACALAAKAIELDEAAHKKLAERACAGLHAQAADGGDPKPDDIAFAALAVAAASPESAARAADSVRALLASAREQPAMVARAILPLALFLREGLLPADLAEEVRAALGQLAESLAARQITADAEISSGYPADLLGGLVPGRARFDVRTTVLTPYAAFALGRIDAFKPMQRGALRFLSQHVAGDPWVGGFRSPDALRGLVRESLGGSECPPERLVMGLLLALAAAENG